MVDSRKSISSRSAWADSSPIVSSRPPSAPEVVTPASHLPLLSGSCPGPVTPKPLWQMPAPGRWLAVPQAGAGGGEVLDAGVQVGFGTGGAERQAQVRGRRFRGEEGLAGHDDDA